MQESEFQGRGPHVWSVNSKEKNNRDNSGATVSSMSHKPEINLKRQKLSLGSDSDPSYKTVTSGNKRLFSFQAGKEVWEQYR